MPNKLLVTSKTRFFIFSTIFLLSISLRIFETPIHGGDSLSNSIRIDYIVSEGKIGWFLSPLSLIGWYPFSYPSGTHSLLSSLVVTCNLPILDIIHIFSFIL